MKKLLLVFIVILFIGFAIGFALELYHVNLWDGKHPNSDNWFLVALLYIGVSLFHFSGRYSVLKSFSYQYVLSAKVREKDLDRENVMLDGAIIYGVSFFISGIIYIVISIFSS